MKDHQSSRASPFLTGASYALRAHSALGESNLETCDLSSFKCLYSRQRAAQGSMEVETERERWRGVHAVCTVQRHATPLQRLLQFD